MKRLPEGRFGSRKENKNKRIDRQFHEYYKWMKRKDRDQQDAEDLKIEMDSHDETKVNLLARSARPHNGEFYDIVIIPALPIPEIYFTIPQKTIKVPIYFTPMTETNRQHKWEEEMEAKMAEDHKRWEEDYWRSVEREMWNDMITIADMEDDFYFHDHQDVGT